MAKTDVHADRRSECAREFQVKVHSGTTLRTLCSKSTSWRYGDQVHVLARQRSWSASRIDRGSLKPPDKHTGLPRRWARDGGQIRGEWTEERPGGRLGQVLKAIGYQDPNVMRACLSDYDLKVARAARSSSARGPNLGDGQRRSQRSDLQIMDTLDRFCGLAQSLSSGARTSAEAQPLCAGWAMARYSRVQVQLPTLMIAMSEGLGDRYGMVPLPTKGSRTHGRYGVGKSWSQGWDARTVVYYLGFSRHRCRPCSCYPCQCLRPSLIANGCGFGRRCCLHSVVRLHEPCSKSTRLRRYSAHHPALQYVPARMQHPGQHRRLNVAKCASGLPCVGITQTFRDVGAVRLLFSLRGMASHRSLNPAWRKGVAALLVLSKQ